MNDTNNSKQEFIDQHTQNLMEKFIVCFNTVSKQYKNSDCLMKEEVAPALVHTATFAAFNFLTYLACHYSLKGEEESFFDDFQHHFAMHCAQVLSQIAAHKEQEDQIIITDEEIINVQS